MENGGTREVSEQKLHYSVLMVSCYWVNNAYRSIVTRWLSHSQECAKPIDNFGNASVGFPIEAEVAISMKKHGIVGGILCLNCSRIDHSIERASEDYEHEIKEFRNPSLSSHSLEIPNNQNPKQFLN
uniref:Uncharacterized protein n=1 Tax=Caenorhabditis tropicalis TaxID=1561998 RepID=A0A1I7TCF0_9PELO